MYKCIYIYTYTYICVTCRMHFDHLFIIVHVRLPPLLVTNSGYSTIYLINPRVMGLLK